MEHEHTQYVAADADAVFTALADPGNLPRYVPQLTAVRKGEGEKITIEARYEGHTQQGEGYFRVNEGEKKIEWGSDASGYRGWMQVAPEAEGARLTLFLVTAHGDAPDGEVMGTLDAIRRLVEASA